MFALLRNSAALALLGLCATVCIRAEKVSDLPQPTTYVNDFAGVIDADSKQKIDDLARQVYTQAHATIEIVTVKSLEGVPIEDFATQLEDKWKVGAKGTDKGVLMIFSMQDHKRRIEVGYGLEGILNDAKVGDIGRSMVPALKEGQYGPAILSGEQQIATTIATDAGVTLDATTIEHTYHREAAPPRRGFSWLGLIVFVFILFMIFGRRGGGGGPGGGSSFLPWFLLGSLMNGGRGGGGGFDSGGGGGFSDGGSSGGDGGDFGGGFGGDSGGGGASGDWYVA